MMFELLCPIKKNARENPDNLAIETDSEQLTYKELDSKLDSTTISLSKMGIQKGQRVAFIAKQSIETVILYFTLCRMQVTACPISTRLPPELITAYISKAKASFFIDTETFQASFISTLSSTPFFEEKLLFSLISTSGSSGSAKMIGHTFENFYYSALGSNLILSLKKEHRWLLSLPLFHVGGVALLFRCFLSGACVVISDHSLSEAIKTLHISHVSLVPTQLYRLIQNASMSALSSLKALLIGGAPISSSLLESAKKLGLPVLPTYGLTEMSAQVTMEMEILAEGVSAGSILPFRQLKISSDGEILVKGKTLFHGYWDAIKGAFELPLKDGWFATSDTGYLNEKGKLIVIGRKDNMFISGGENIHPEMIENALLEIPGISQAVVVPIDDEEFGQRPVAFIDSTQGYIMEEEIKLKLKRSLPKFCIPIGFYPIPQEALCGLKVSRSFLKMEAQKANKALAYPA